MTRRKHLLKTTVAALAATATLGLAGCGTDQTAQPGGMGGMDHSSPTAPSTTPNPSAGASASEPTAFNDADVAFAQMMTPHHEQAVTMSNTLLKKSGLNPEVTVLAEEIKAAQQPEIEKMKGWLTAWGKGSRDGGMAGMDHGSSHDGMATDAELQKLDQADGADGQKMYLVMMTAHHEGAIKMAQTELSDGKNPEAVQLAKAIVASQQQELTVMKDLLGKL
jgi:uncharacterized protein (DUF305 family)